MQRNYSIKVYKQYFNFASSHFLVAKDGSRERLHGHNYRVSVIGKGNRLKEDVLFDFLDMKPLVKEICDSLDHCLLLPMENLQLEMANHEDNIEVRTPDGSFFSFPKEDVLMLPVPNITSEHLAAYIAYKIKGGLSSRYGHIFDYLEVEVEESPGQSASFVLEGCS